MDWIDTNVELPKTERGVHAKRYLVSSQPWSSIGFAYYSKQKGWHRRSKEVCNQLISHWIMPKLPTGEWVNPYLSK